MFTKESLYINAVKYDTQLKLDYKKLNNGLIIDTNNSVFLVDEDILPLDIAHKLNTSQEEFDETYISTLLISDTTKLVPKAISAKLKDCEIAKFNNEYDIAVLKTTLFETKNYFVKTGIDYIYSAFHIMNLHLEQKVCKNELLMFLFNSKAFIIIVNQSGIIVYHKTVDLLSFDSIKKTHFYEDDLDGQKLFDEIYYLELSEIIHETLNDFYTKKKGVFVEKITILYTLKQLENEQIQQLNDELLLKVEYQPINIDEEIFELSKDKHLKKSFIKPRKKKKKRNYTNLYIAIFLVAISFIGYKAYETFAFKEDINIPKIQTLNSENQISELPDHVGINDRIERRIKAIFDSINFDVIVREMKITKDYLQIKGMFFDANTFDKSLKPSLELLYQDTEFNLLTPEKKLSIEGTVIAKDEKELNNIIYKTYSKEYITDELLPIQRVSEQLKILMPQGSIIKFLASSNDGIIRFNYLVNILVKEPKEFFELIDNLNSELYSINIAYPISLIKTEAGIEIEFNLSFNQPK